MRRTARPPASSAEVARRAGVSRTTVSFVLNDVRDRGISESTWQRVLAAAKELGYEPNAAARTLAGGATRTVALVVPQLEHLHVDAFLAQLVASVTACCHLHGLRLLIESTDGQGREPGGFLQLVRSRSIDGLIVAHLRTTEIGHLRRLRDSGTPLVVFGCNLPAGEGFATMGDDTWRSAQMAVKHLLDLGHRRVGLVNYAPAEFHSASQRERGWRQALTDHGIRPDPRWLVNGNISAQSGYEATRELLSRAGGLTAVLAGNDTIAFGVLRALREVGLRVPQDMALVGYDDIPLAPFAVPPLTSVRTDPVGHGRQAVHLLINQLHAGKSVAPAALPAPTLVVRESCGASTPSAQSVPRITVSGKRAAHQPGATIDTRVMAAEVSKRRAPRR